MTHLLKFFTALVFLLFTLILFISYNNFAESPSYALDSIEKGQRWPAQTLHSGNHLTVIVPFRERFTDLSIFIPHMHRYLDRKGLAHTIFVINQVDSLRFNRGMLLNIGVKESALMFANGTGVEHGARFLVPSPIASMLALHDVDLLPMDLSLKYDYIGTMAYHLIPHWLHPVYHFYPKYSGGIMLLSRETFSLVNGFSNRFWGWGREDDDFALRLKEADIKILSEKKAYPKEPKFKDIHSQLSKRDKVPYYNPVPHTRDPFTGLSTLKYDVVSRMEIMIAGSAAWVINVKLYCNIVETPLCNFDS